MDDTAGNRITAAQTESLTKGGGTIVIVGNVMGNTPMIFYKIAHKELVIKTVHRCRNVFPLAVQAIADKRIDISRIAADCFAFDDGIQAFEKSLKDKQTVVKAILKMESSLRPAYTPLSCAPAFCRKTGRASGPAAQENGEHLFHPVCQWDALDTAQFG